MVDVLCPNCRQVLPPDNTVHPVADPVALALKGIHQRFEGEQCVKVKMLGGAVYCATCLRLLDAAKPNRVHPKPATRRIRF